MFLLTKLEFWKGEKKKYINTAKNLFSISIAVVGILGSSVDIVNRLQAAQYKGYGSILGGISGSSSSPKRPDEDYVSFQNITFIFNPTYSKPLWVSVCVTFCNAVFLLVSDVSLRYFDRLDSVLKCSSD